MHHDDDVRPDRAGSPYPVGSVRAWREGSGTTQECSGNFKRPGSVSSGYWWTADIMIPVERYALVYGVAIRWPGALPGSTTPGKLGKSRTRPARLRTFTMWPVEPLPVGCTRNVADRPTGLSPGYVSASMLPSAAGVGLIELLLAILTGSVGLLGDAIHNLSDVSTSAVVFLGFRLSWRPPPSAIPTAWNGPRT